MFSSRSLGTVKIDFISFNGDVVKIEGCIDSGVLRDGESLMFGTELSDGVYPVWVERKQRVVYGVAGVEFDGGAFEVELGFNIASGDSIHAFALSARGVRKLKLLPTEFTRLGEVRLSYAVYEGVVCRRESDGTISIRPTARRLILWYELCFLFNILFYWRLTNARSALKSATSNGVTLRQRLISLARSMFIVGESIVMMPRAYILRICYRFDARSKSRPVWLISDRGMSAGDNGEALFRYVSKLNQSQIDVYFVISRKSKDYSRMRSIGPVVDQGSFRYKRLFLVSDKVISSQADVEVTNPFLRQKSHFIDLYKFDFVFLQHGIIRHDLSEWLNRFNKNISLFITSSQIEYDSIVNGSYYYSENNILLSGLPRYDYLSSSPKGKLILAPTYRKELITLDSDSLGERSYDSNFKHSHYREFYNNLMNDARVIDALEKHSMIGELYLHPAFSSQIEDFDSNDIFKTKDFPYDYRLAFREGNLLVSDYSSVVFDFAYLKKPVIYTQFDKDRFFTGHSYQKSDFYSDEDDGFGPVVETYESAVDAIVRMIESGCQMEDVYKDRVDKFFYSTDGGNSKRVYDAILGASSQ